MFKVKINGREFTLSVAELSKVPVATFIEVVSVR